MTSAELRRIVGAMTQEPPDPFDCPDETCPGGHDPRVCPWLLGTEARRAAHETLANHATALVALLEACEQFARACSSDDDWAARQAIMAALDAVHAKAP